MVRKICMIVGLFSWMVVTGQAQTGKTLTILHTNDMHSRVEPFPEEYADTLWAGKGGLLRRVTYVQEQRQECPDLLLLDAGDFSQGTPYYNMYKGEVEIRLMNRMGYDAATIGNHEFDFGMDNMVRLFRMADFPIVCANYDVSGTVLEDWVKEYVVLERGGLRIGVFGLGAELDGLVKVDLYEGIRFENPIVEGQRVASLLHEREKCDLVICLSHLGWKGGKWSDVELVKSTRYIDMVVGGHSHSLFDRPVTYRNLDGCEVPVFQMGKHGAFVGKMTVKLSKDNKK